MTFAAIMSGLDAPPAYAAEDENGRPEVERGVSDNSGDNGQPAQRRQSSGAGARKGRPRAPRGAAQAADAGKRKKQFTWADGQAYYNHDRASGHGLDGVGSIATVDFHHNLTFFVPWSTWIANARHFDDIQPNNRRAEMYRKLIAFFLELARDLRDWDLSKDTPSEHFHPVIIWETCGDRSWSSDHTTTVSGFRVRLTCRRFQLDGDQPECDISMKIWDMLTQSLRAERSWWSFNPQEWLDMTQRLFQVTMSKRELSIADVTNPFGVCYPARLFSLEKAIEHASGLIPATNPVQLDIRHYKEVVEGFERWVFPYPEQTFRFDLEHANADRLRQYYFPHLRPRATDAQVETELREYFRGKDPSTLSQDEIDRMRVHFTYCSSYTPTNPEVFTLAKLKAKNRERVKEAAQLAAQDLPDPKERTADQKAEYERRYAETLKQASIAGIKEFMAKIWIPDALTLPPPVQANVKQWFEHFKKYRNPCILRKQRHRSLSRIADKFASVLIMLHTGKFVESGHVDILRFWLAALHVYLSRDLRINIVTIGVSSNGKSFSLKVLEDMLVKNTWANVMYQTQKAVTGLDRIPDHLAHTITPEEKVGFMRQEKRITLMEEVPASMLGVSHPSTQHGSSDAESMEKNRRTASSVTYSALHIAKDGTRVFEEQTVQCSDVLLGVTNPFKGTINPYIASRYAVIHQTAKNASRILNAMLAKPTPEGKRLWDQFTELTRWDQVRVCLIAYLIETECLAEVDTTASDAVIAAVIEEGRTQGLRQLENVRNAQRVRMMAEVICVLEAIDTFFDSECSPLVESEWRDEYLVGLRKYLRTTKEHAVMALGLFRSQYEDPVVPVAEQAIQQVIKWYARKRQESQAEHEKSVREVEREIATALRRGRREDASVWTEKLNEMKDWRERRANGWVWSSADPSFDLKSDEDSTSIPDNQIGLGDNSVSDAPGAQWPEHKFLYGKHTIDEADLAKMFNKCMDTEKMIGKLSRQIHEVPMKCNKPGKEDLPTVLRTLLNMTVTVDGWRERADGSKESVGKREVPALTLACRQEGSDWKYEMSIPEGGFSKHSVGMLHEVIEKVLSHKYARQERLLYGASDSKYPYLFQCIDIRPNPLAGMFKLTPPGYFERVIQEASLALVKDVAATARGAVATFSLDEVFQNQMERCDLNTDIDRFAIDRLEQRERLTECELMLKPSHHPVVLEWELWHGRKDKLVYPECLTESVESAEDDNEPPRKKVMLASEVLAGLKRVRNGQATEQDERDWDRHSSQRSRRSEEEEEQAGDEAEDGIAERSDDTLFLNRASISALTDNNYGKSYINVIDAKWRSLEPEDLQPYEMIDEEEQSNRADNSGSESVADEEDAVERPSPTVRRRHQVVEETEEEKMEEEDV